MIHLTSVSTLTVYQNQNFKIMEDQNRSLHGSLRSLMELGYLVQFSTPNEGLIRISLHYEGKDTAHYTHPIEFMDEVNVVKILMELFIRLHSV